MHIQHSAHCLLRALVELHYTIMDTICVCRADVCIKWDIYCTTFDVKLSLPRELDSHGGRVGVVFVFVFVFILVVPV